MTAKTKDGKEVYKNSKIYMPVPQQFARGDRMGRGPYEKSGMLRDTSIPPHKTIIEKFEIPLYTESKDKDGKKTRTKIADDFIVTAELWYMPYGVKDDSARMWQKFTKEINLSKSGK